MSTLFRTSRPESSATLLATQLERVVISAVHALTTRIPLQRKKLRGEYFLGKNGRHADAEIRRWSIEGGLLVNYRYEVPPADAQVFVECPLSMSDYIERTVHTRHCAVIYRPPWWKYHEQEIDRLHPPSEVCLRLHEAVRGAPIANPWYLEALGLPTAGAVSMDDPDLCALVGITNRQLKMVRQAVLRGVRGSSACRVQPLILRAPPTDRAMLPFYQRLETLPELRGVKLALNNELGRDRTVWRPPLRKLVREGCVTKLPAVGFYIPDDIRPDFKRIEQENRQAKERLAQMIAAVEDATELTAEALRRLLKRRGVPSLDPQSRSSSGGQSESSAHARRTIYEAP